MSELFPRLLDLPDDHSFFLYGARNTGKSTHVKAQYDGSTSLYIDLLDSETEARFLSNPNALYDIVKSLPDKIIYVIIDEVQKIPKLLDVVHRLIEEKLNKYFIMTGSSARKLKKGGANLLAGRAFVYHMFPLTFLELGDRFSLESVLHWGSLPPVINAKSDKERTEFLYAYTQTYLKEEIWEEQFIKQLDPFRRFLEVAAQCNGEVVNFSNIARDVGVSDKTIMSYYSILEDTLVGFFLEAYHGSFRKRLSKQPKFYLFDIGITRALSFQVDVKLMEKTSAYGNAFEHFIILECMRLSDYHRLRYRFSFIRTQHDVEIDLVVERPGKPMLCIEIKSAKVLDDKKLKSFIDITSDIENSEAICICNEQFPRKFEHVMVLPWKMALETFFVK